jgi:lysophospholipase L1-like esterase
MKLMKIHLVLSVLVLGLVSNSFSKSPAPTYANVAYDTHERTVLDFWQAEGEGPRPLLVYIHGGGWMKGDKRAMKHADVYLKQGISVAAVNYRLVPEHPLPAPVHDAARAVQFLRSKANEWQIDTNNVVLSGGSAGGCSSLWIACHDDLAKPDSNDPVESESSRVQGAAVLSAQTSIDPKVIEPWIGPKVFLSMIYKAVGEDTLESMQVNYAQHEAVYEAFSPINHLSQDDPPLFLEYPDRPEFMALPATSFNYGIHHGMFGIKMKAQSAAVGHNKVELQIKDHDESSNYASVDDFIIKTLLGKQAVSVAKAQAADAPQPSTVIPVPSQLKKFMPKRHNAKLKEAEERQIDLVMIGDSITHNWESMGNYASTFDGRNLLNLGFAGDRTQNVLWRIQHGALDGIAPKLVTLMIGTNHMHLPKKGYTPDTPEDIFTGIQAVVAEIRTRLPDSKLIVFSVFPRGPEAAQERAEAVNAMLPQLADQEHVFHMNINHAFLGEGGALNKALYKGDQLHLNLQGYEAWAKVLVPLLEGADLKDTSVSSSNEATKVACIGDSITFGHGINDRETNSYPAQLGALLGDAYQVKNFGVSGSTMLKQGNKPYWKQKQFQAAQDFEPDLVVIKLGTNDMKARNWKFKADYKADYIDMIRTFQGLPSQPDVLICYPAPVFRTKGDFKDSIVREELIPLVDEVSHDAGVRVIDLYQPLAEKPELSRDGLHPNVAGATVMAETVADAITGKGIASALCD